MSKKKVSVIIPVFNEEKYIEGCLNSLARQTYPREDMEWILVDGNSTDRTREIIEKFAGAQAGGYPIILLSNPERKTPRSLNLGIQQATGDIIIRFDAHALFPEDYIEQCVHCLETVEADNVGGWIETKGKGFIGQANAKILSSKFGVGGSSFRIGTQSGYVDTVPFGAFKKEVFEKLGLFNEALLRSEDNDINARIIESGGKVYLSDKIHSTYFCRDTVGGLLKMGLQNGNALFRTLKLNPKAMSLRHFIPFLFLMSLILMPILGAIFQPFWILFAVEMGLYFLLDLYFSFFRGEKSGGAAGGAEPGQGESSISGAKLGLVTIWLYPLFHICYGLGSLLGLVGVELY